MESLHPIVVHFAIALISIGIVADGIYQISRNERYGAMVVPLLIGGLVFAISAVITGLQAEKTVEIPAHLQDHVNAHRISAILATVGTAITLVLHWLLEKYRYTRGMLKWGYRLVAIATLAMLFRTGLLGGEMVYKYGIGTQQEKSVPPSRELFQSTDDN